MRRRRVLGLVQLELFGFAPAVQVACLDELGQGRALGLAGCLTGLFADANADEPVVALARLFGRQAQLGAELVVGDLRLARILDAEVGARAGQHLQAVGDGAQIRQVVGTDARAAHF